MPERNYSFRVRDLYRRFVYYGATIRVSWVLRVPINGGRGTYVVRMLTEAVLINVVNFVPGGQGGSDRHKRKSWEASTCQPVAPQGTTPHGHSRRFQKGTPVTFSFERFATIHYASANTLSEVTSTVSFLWCRFVTTNAHVSDCTIPSYFYQRITFTGERTYFYR